MNRQSLHRLFRVWFWVSLPLALAGAVLIVAGAGLENLKLAQLGGVLVAPLLLLYYALLGLIFVVIIKMATDFVRQLVRCVSRADQKPLTRRAKGGARTGQSSPLGVWDRDIDG